jgi:hypothetical protein
MADEAQSDGRKENGAQPLGERHGLVSKAGARRTAAKELRSAGPDGPEADPITKPPK